MTDPAPRPHHRPRPTRYLAIDLGGKRTGLAVGDDETRICTPVEVIVTAARHELIQRIQRAAVREGADALVLGLPFNMDGSEGPAAKNARAFGAEAAAATGLPIQYADERLTSAAADDLMANTGLTHKQKKNLRDALAAATILRDFLHAQHALAPIGPRDTSLPRLRDALDRCDVAGVADLLKADPGLASAQPWAPDHRTAAIDAAADRCVYHRPQARDIVLLLIEHGAPCSLHTAARAGLHDRVTALLDDGGLLDTTDDAGRTGLYRAACVYGRFDEGVAVADLLIERGAAIDLHTACTLGLLAQVNSILDADPAAARRPDPHGMTALHWAARARRYRQHADAITRRLLRDGADPHATNPTEDGMTPLHHAAEWPGIAAQVEALLDAGADINAQTPHRWTPLDYALDRKREEMAALLRRLGGVRGASLGA